jgi:hypothetical protein
MPLPRHEAGLFKLPVPPYCRPGIYRPTGSGLASSLRLMLAQRLVRKVRPA